METVIVASLLAILAAAPAGAQPLPDGTTVRVVPNGAGDGAPVAGKLGRNKGSGCTMVTLDRALPGGYTMLALNAVRRLERRDGGAWVDVPVAPLLAREPKDCREAAND